MFGVSHVKYVVKVVSETKRQHIHIAKLRKMMADFFLKIEPYDNSFKTCFVS